MKRELKELFYTLMFLVSLAAAQIPMKRELKGLSLGSCVIKIEAAAQIPMKRELKVNIAIKVRNCC